MRSTCYVPSFNFFLGAVSEIQRSKVFPIWLPHHVTYDVIIIIETFNMSSCANGENFFSIRQAVAEKNTKVLCGQIKKQTYRQTDRNRQTNKQMDQNAIPSLNPLARVISQDGLVSASRWKKDLLGLSDTFRLCILSLTNDPAAFSCNNSLS